MPFRSSPGPENLVLRVHKHVRLHASPEDGTRILVMRFYPRGVKKGHVDEWIKGLAPSPELLRWCWANKDTIDPETFAVTWKRRYREEMDQRADLIEGLRTRLRNGETLTLLCVCHRPDDCHRLELSKIIRERSSPD